MGQRCSCPDGVLDLPTINIPRGEFPNFLGVEGHADLGQECIPNLRLGNRVEIVEVEGNMDTRTEGIVDDLYSVGCEEEDSTVVLEMTKAERGRTCKQRIVVSRTNLAHKTATMAFRMRSCSERCSMKTSACGTVRYSGNQGFQKWTNLVNQNDRLPRRGDIKSAF